MSYLANKIYFILQIGQSPENGSWDRNNFLETFKILSCSTCPSVVICRQRARTRLRIQIFQLCHTFFSKYHLSVLSFHISAPVKYCYTCIDSVKYCKTVSVSVYRLLYCMCSIFAGTVCSLVYIIFMP